jgi:hypothetical protein
MKACQVIGKEQRLPGDAVAKDGRELEDRRVAAGRLDVAGVPVGVGVKRERLLKGKGRGAAGKLDTPPRRLGRLGQDIQVAALRVRIDRHGSVQSMP